MAQFNVKTIDKKTIEVEGKLVNKPNLPKPPLWFTSWTNQFEKKIDERFDNIDQRLDNIDQRIDNLVKLNNLQE